MQSASIRQPATAIARVALEVTLEFQQSPVMCESRLWFHRFVQTALLVVVAACHPAIGSGISPRPSAALRVRQCKRDTQTDACAEERPVQRATTRDSKLSQGNHASTGTTSFIFEGNRVYALLTFLKPDGSAHAAYAYVDMGAADMALSAPLYDSLGVSTGAPARFKVGDYALEAPAANIRRGGSPNVGGSRPQLEASLPASVLQHHALVLDYEHRTLTLGDPGSTAPSGTPVPFRLDTATGLIAVDATIDGETYSMTIDNGSAYTWVRQDAASQWLRRHPDWERGVGAVGTANMMLRGEQPEREGILIRIPELSIGAIRLTQVGALAVTGGRGMDTSLALMDWYSKKNPVPVLGWLGGNVFKAFRFTVDYQKHMMYWLRQAEPDTSDLHQVGLTLRTAPHAVYVVAVATKNGKPTVEGVLPGDQLISVAGHELGSGTIGQIFESMHGAPGATRELVLERNGVRFTVTAAITAF